MDMSVSRLDPLLAKIPINIVSRGKEESNLGSMGGFDDYEMLAAASNLLHTNLFACNEIGFDYSQIPFMPLFMPSLMEWRIHSK